MTLDIGYSYITWRIELGSNRKTMQFNVKVVHTLTHLILPGHPTLPFEGFRGKYSVGQAHTYPCGQVYGFDRREGVARPESKHQIIIIIII